MILLGSALTPNRIIVHSSKGTTWDDHKYVKKVNGVYYYPKDYKGERHAGDTKKGEIQNDEQYDTENKDWEQAEEAWESTVYSDIDKIMKENPDLTDPVRLAQLAFDNNLRGKMSDAEIERMMDKVRKHYGVEKKEDDEEKKKDKEIKHSAKETTGEKWTYVYDTAKKAGKIIDDKGRRAHQDAINEALSAYEISRDSNNDPNRYAATAKKLEDYANYLNSYLKVSEPGWEAFTTEEKRSLSENGQRYKAIISGYSHEELRKMRDEAYEQASLARLNERTAKVVQKGANLVFDKARTQALEAGGYKKISDSLHEIGNNVVKKWR